MRLAQSNDFMHAHIRVFNWRSLRRTDPFLAAVIVLLAAIGIAVLLSANRSASGYGAMPFYLKQLIFFGGGCALALFVACVDHRFIVSIGPFVYAFFLACLIAVLFVGTTVKGGQRWLDLGPIGFQPSEQTKLGVILMLAWYLNAVGRRIERFHVLVGAFVIAGVPSLLIFLQPNLGTALAMVPIAFAMVYVAGCRTRHLIVLVLAGLACAPILWSQMKDYQKTRVLTVLNPTADPLGSGYHTIQSMITIGSGGLSGKGYMEGTQTYLSYLPEHHTDFIFSLLAEEFGFIGGVTVLVLFFLLLLRALVVARQSSDMSGSLLGTGVVALLLFHVLVNIAITLGMMPVTGIPLPFLSYGGSFYLTTMLCMGLLFSVNSRKGLFA